MSVYVECKGNETALKNTGAKEQCLEGLFIKPFLAHPGFSFETFEDAKNKEKWVQAIADKKIIPLFDVEELASANTEDTLFEGRRKQYVTAKGKKVSTFSSFLSLCSFNALKSYNGKDMQLFEFTEDGAIKAVHTDSKGVKGQGVVLNIGKRLDATADRPPSVLVTINYKDFNEFEDHGVILYPDFVADDLFGIFDVHLSQVSASATEIIVKASTGCGNGGAAVSDLKSADFVVKDASGQVQTVSFAENKGEYVLTGTDFADGFTVSLNDVITIEDLSYEAVEPLVVKLT
ncbi:hypothetical protein K5I29_04205 [Flavobacterium agricola]|uniref:Uncharacterized protein n=1 Tax=Flavobacterium agricola TaxID=2870839 RepID=A0ABY6M3N0_9FLAO|nr:hypothetical protein [Flavobacterium agricola]UYW02110.1 hypothetical protein K5I29_04205 [Flavobacterium agricola]